MEELSAMMEGSFGILTDTYYQLRKMKRLEAIKPVAKLSDKLKEIYNKKEKKDTLYMDVLAEQCLAGSELLTGNLDLIDKVLPGHEGVWITEERGVVTKKNIDPLSHNQLLISAGTPVFISDPIDQSRQIEEMAKKYSTLKTFGHIFDNELKYRGDMARVDAPNVSVTFLKDNQIMYTMILNLLTREVYIGSDKGVYSGDITQAKSIADIRTPVKFKTKFDITENDWKDLEGRLADKELKEAKQYLRKKVSEDNRSMISYVYGDKYEHNWDGTNLRFFTHEDSVEQPPGPLRFAYLLEGNGIGVPNVGSIAFNGEKVQELLPNVAMAYFSNGQLSAWKLFCRPDKLEERDGKLMTPNMANSLFKGDMRNHGIEYTHMNRHKTPNNFRDTVVILPTQNHAAKSVLRGMEYTKPEQSIRIIG